MSKFKNYSFIALSVFAIIFGVLTIKSAYLVLFTTGEFHQAQGNYVPFVVMFNGLSGFVYIIAAIGLLMKSRWGARLASVLAISIAVVYCAFGLHVLNGGLYEMQTVVAMFIRNSLWMILAAFSYIIILKEAS